MTSKLLKIGFIGGGKMAQALAKGFISAGLSKGENMISSCHPLDFTSAKAFKEIGAEAISENAPVVQKSDICIISVKPNVVPIALADIKKASGIKTDKLFLSIAMGVPLKQLEKYLPSNSRVMRVMPNNAAIVNSGASVYCRGSTITEEDVAVTKSLLESVGISEEVPEFMLDAVTALSGSGPAYVYILIEAFADGGVKMGLPRDLAYRLAAQTVMGAGKMVRDTSIHPGILKDDVTSPAGCTATGLHYLERNGFRSAIIGAVEAATIRCMEQTESQD